MRSRQSSPVCEPKSDPRDRLRRSYTGYLDTDSYGKNLFFYFFLSRDKPVTDDVLLWIK